MSINIQTANGLVRISNEKITKEKIIESLGYVPANEKVLPNIEDYYNILGFDTSEIVFAFDSNNTSAVLGQAVLDKLILDNDGSNNGVEVASVDNINMLSDGYSKQNFKSGQILKAEHLNNIENGIDELYNKISEIENSTLLTVIGEGNDNEENTTPEAPVLTNISVTYSGGNVPVGTSISSLSGIVVRASYSDGTSKVVTQYNLSSGNIVEGSNTITVTYQEKTATFNVTGVNEIVNCTLTINATPSDAIVKIGNVVQNSVTVTSGTTVSWSVSKEGYVTQQGTKKLTSDETMSIVLNEMLPAGTVQVTQINDYSINEWIRPTGVVESGSTTYLSTDYIQVDAYDELQITGMFKSRSLSPVVWYDESKTFISAVNLNATEYSSVDVANDATITVEVPSNAVYARFSIYYNPSAYSSNANVKGVITGELNYVSFTIVPNPSDATVKINRIEQSSVSVIQGVSVLWEVSKEGYVTQSNEVVVNVDTEIEVILELQTSDNEFILADLDDYSCSGFIRKTSGARADNASYICTDFIDVTQYSHLKVSVLLKAASNAPVSWYDAEQNWISSESSTDYATYTTYDYDVPENAVYARFSSYKPDINNTQEPIVIATRK